MLRGTSLYDDVTLALDLSCRMAALQKSAGNLWAAADQAEITAELAEGAFGWDAAVAGERRKEVRDESITMSDLNNVTYLIHSLF